MLSGTDGRFQLPQPHNRLRLPQRSRDTHLLHLLLLPRTHSPGQENYEGHDHSSDSHESRVSDRRHDLLVLRGFRAATSRGEMGGEQDALPRSNLPLVVRNHRHVFPAHLHPHRYRGCHFLSLGLQKNKGETDKSAPGKIGFVSKLHFCFIHTYIQRARGVSRMRMRKISHVITHVAALNDPANEAELLKYSFHLAHRLAGE